MLVAVTSFVALLSTSSRAVRTPYSGDGEGDSCDSVSHGYQCEPSISHFWGQYSPYYSVPSEISTKIPSECSLTFAQILSRHGARDPTESKTEVYETTIQKIKSNVKTFTGKYSFLSDYDYTLGADQLTTFGQQELVNSGIKFYHRYRSLTREDVPFVRSSGEDRVVESAKNWTQGFQMAKKADRGADHDNNAYPHVDVIIPETDYGTNNTLNHELCTEFENGTYSEISDDAEAQWAKTFATPVQVRLNNDLPGANLSLDETIYMMDLCPFNTVASVTGEISPFCDLFTEDEWHEYNYYETLDKWYGYSFGNPLGPSQGVGFVNELIARLTGQPVLDHTSTNHTLDENSTTFPLGRSLYADFSHDNDMTAIFSGLGLYNGTAQFPNTTVVEAGEANGYSAAWTVPFAARMYVEKMQCSDHDDEMVRVIINDRVQPLTQCSGDSLGRCTLTAFIDSLAFARSGGHWDQCFV